MPFGQSYAVYRGVGKLIKIFSNASSKITGEPVNERDVEIATAIYGGWFATLTALATGDIPGGSAVALDIAEKTSGGKFKPKGP